MARLTGLVGLVAVLALVGATGVAADTPANCTYGDMLGHWNIWVSTPGDKTMNCTSIPASISVPGVTLAYPDVAKDDVGNVGNWTLIYNQGVEVWIAGRIYFAYSAYDANNSYCDRTQIGWAHDMDGLNWMCFRGQRTSQGEIPAELVAEVEEAEVEDLPAEFDQPEEVDAAAPTPRQPKIILGEDSFQRAAKKPSSHRRRVYKTNHAFLDKVNSAQSSFRVKHYPEFDGMSLEDLQRRRGGSAGAKVSLRDALPPRAKRVDSSAARRYPSLELPASFDWRNVNNESFVSPVRNQGQCGSCYAFSSAGMMEARIRIASGNKLQPILSPQDVVSCSEFSQGCEGGFPYLIAGKYGRDFGLAEEACYPYAGVDSACSPNPQPGCNPQRWMTNEYYYIGGYYGATTAELMQEEIMTNGPISVSFEVYDDFMSYSGGVYSHQFTKHLKDDFNPFELVNHAVLAVGWGVTDDGNNTPYWIVKNSWGSSWGENGFFRILRGSTEPGGECAIESIAVSAIPILH